MAEQVSRSLRIASDRFTNREFKVFEQFLSLYELTATTRAFSGMDRRVRANRSAIFKN